MCGEYLLDGEVDLLQWHFSIMLNYKAPAYRKSGNLVNLWVHLPFVHLRPTDSAILQPVYCRQAGLSSLRRQSLEQSPCTSHLSTVAHGFPAASSDFSLPILT